MAIKKIGLGILQFGLFLCILGCAGGFSFCLITRGWSIFSMVMGVALLVSAYLFEKSLNGWEIET